MAKLFIFGIGGTGSRVLKSLSLLLASGVSMGKYIDEIVPIIIDVDKGNEDLTRTLEILKNYSSLNEVVAKDNANYKGFFQTKMTNLFPNNGSEYRLNIQEVQGRTFGEYIDHQTLTGQNKAFIDLLFSGTQDYNGTPKPLLEMDMKEGFQGNPKLGCVVLNQFVGNPDFDKFANNFSQGDRIFIISSIHGGTGAAGFPLLLKNLRTAKPPTPNSGLLNNALIGAITVLPYYKLQAGDIKSEDFVSKAKAALQYYVKNVNPSLNSLYYIGNESNTNNYKNHRGGNQQKNPAHFVEFAAALSIVDFAEQAAQAIAQQGSRFMEFGVNDYNTTIDFSTFGNATRTMVLKPLSQYHFFNLYLEKQIKHSITSQPWSNRGKVKIPKSFIQSQTGFYSTLLALNSRYKEWLKELEENDPAFKPFSPEAGLLCSINGVSPHKPQMMRKFMRNYALFDDYLNEAERKVGDISQEQKFIEIFNYATSLLTD